MAVSPRHPRLEHVERTLDFVEELDPFAAVMLVWVEDSEVVNPQIELERRHFRDEIYERIRRRAEQQTRWVVPTLGIRFNARTFAVLRKLGLRGAALAVPGSLASPRARYRSRIAPLADAFERACHVST